MILPRYVWMQILVACLLITSSAMAVTIHRSFAGGYPQSATDARVRVTEQRAKPKGMALVEAGTEDELLREDGGEESVETDRRAETFVHEMRRVVEEIVRRDDVEV